MSNLSIELTPEEQALLQSFLQDHVRGQNMDLFACPDHVKLRAIASKVKHAKPVPQRVTRSAAFESFAKVFEESFEL